jgi:pyruvate/2-oxoglutarate dehydrogenase complex dihydrolipoamide dehydrogenase (E3) component
MFDLENENTCYLKLVTDKSQNEKVLGFHILAPNAGEITQGIALAIKKGITKQDLDDTVGIHPTIAEVKFI